MEQTNLLLYIMLGILVGVLYALNKILLNQKLILKKRK